MKQKSNECCFFYDRRKGASFEKNEYAFFAYIKMSYSAIHMHCVIHSVFFSIMLEMVGCKGKFVNFFRIKPTKRACFVYKHNCVLSYRLFD